MADSFPNLNGLSGTTPPWKRLLKRRLPGVTLRNPPSAKRKCRRIGNTLILGLVYPSKDYSLGRGPRVLMSMVSAIAW